jgi:hypothetical protein
MHEDGAMDDVAQQRVRAIRAAVVAQQSELIVLLAEAHAAVSTGDAEQVTAIVQRIAASTARLEHLCHEWQALVSSDVADDEPQPPGSDAAGSRR